MIQWLLPALAIPVLMLSWWTSNALYEFLRAYRSVGDRAAYNSTFPVEPEAFRAHMSQPVRALLRTPALTLDTLVAAFRRHSDAGVERSRRRYVFRLALLLVVAALWLTISVLLVPLLFTPT